MFMEHDQLVQNGHIYDWKPIENRSHQLRTHIDVPCPRCEHAITPIDHDYFVCDACDTVADIQLLKLNSKAIVIEVNAFDVSRYLEEQDAELEPETHIVYCKVREDSTVIIRKKMRCLSCDKPIRKRILRYPRENEEADPNIETVYCSSNCRVRTYLRAAYDSTGIFIAPYLEAYDTPAPNDPLEIPVIDAPPVARPPAIDVRIPTPTLGNSPQTRQVDNIPEPPVPPSPNAHSNQSIDLEGQILSILPADRTLIKAQYLLAHIGGRRKSKYAAISRLINKGLIERTEQGWYRRC